MADNLELLVIEKKEGVLLTNIDKLETFVQEKLKGVHARQLQGRCRRGKERPGNAEHVKENFVTGTDQR